MGWWTFDCSKLGYYLGYSHTKYSDCSMVRNEDGVCSLSLPWDWKINEYGQRTKMYLNIYVHCTLTFIIIRHINFLSSL